MKAEELYRRVREVLPGADFQFDNYNQLIIYTGLQINGDDEVEDFVDDPLK
jgi:hypothetical protein